MSTCGVSQRAQEVTNLLRMMGLDATTQAVVAEMKAQSLTDDMDANEIASKLTEVWGEKIGGVVMTHNDLFNGVGMQGDDAARMSACQAYVNVREAQYVQKYAEGRYQDVASKNGLKMNVEDIAQGDVAYVQIDGATDVDGTLRAISVVLSRGGAVALSEPELAGRNQSTAKKWNAIVSKMHKYGVGHQHVPESSAYVFSKGVSLTMQTEQERAVNEDLERQCEGREMSVNGIFGASYVKHQAYSGDEASVFDMIYDGKVDAVAKRLFDTDYSEWQPGSVVKIKRTKKGVEDVVYCKVSSVERLSIADANARKEEIAAATGVSASSLAFDREVAFVKFEKLGGEKRIGDTSSLKAAAGRGKRKGEKYKGRKVRMGKGGAYVYREMVASKAAAEAMNRLADVMLALAKAQGLPIEDINEEIERMKKERSEKARSDAKEKEQLVRDIITERDRQLFSFNAIEASVDRDKLVDVFGSNKLANEFIECMAEMVLYDLDDRERYEADLKEQIESGELRLKELSDMIDSYGVQVDDDGTVTGDVGTESMTEEQKDAVMGECVEYIEMKRDLDAQRRRLAALMDGQTRMDWVKDPEIIKSALQYIHDDIAQAAWAYEAVKEILEEHPEITELNGIPVSGMSFEEKIKQGIRQANNEGIEGVAVPKFPLSGYLDEKGSGGEFFVNSIRYVNMINTNVDLHNGMAAIVDDEDLWKSCVSKALMKLSKRCGAVLRMSEVEEVDTLVQDENGNDVEEQEMQENNDREGYSIEVGTVSQMRSMLQQVRQSMFTIPRYVKDENGEWVEEVDTHFGNTKYMVPTIVNATLLKLLHDCKDGDDMMRRLNDMVDIHPWLRGVLDLLESDESMRTGYFVSFKKGRLNYRVWRHSGGGEGKVESMSSWGSNYGEDEAAISTAIRMVSSCGIILNREYSLYDTNGMCNYENGTKLKKLLESLTPPTKDTAKDWLDSEDNIDALITAFNAIGVDSPDAAQIRRMFTLQPDVLPDLLTDLKKLAGNAEVGYKNRNRIKYPEPYYSYCWDLIVSVGGKLSLLSEDYYDNMSVENHKSRYGYANPNSVDVMADAMGDPERFDEYVREHYLPVDENGRELESYFFSEEDGVTCGWLRDLMDNEGYRWLFKLEHQKHINIDDKEYQNWTSNDLTRLRLGMFLHPMGKKHMNINRDTFDSRTKGIEDKPMALYAMPIMSDSKNMIALPGRVFWAYSSEEFVNDELLNRFAEVVLNEYRRIRIAYIEDGTQGKSDLGVFEKNAKKFQMFPELNNDDFLTNLNNLAKVGDKQGMISYVKQVMKEKVLPDRVRSAILRLYDDGFFAKPFNEDEATRKRFWVQEFYGFISVFRKAMRNEEVRAMGGDEFQTPTIQDRVWASLTDEEREFVRSQSDTLYALDVYVGNTEERRREKERLIKLAFEIKKKVEQMCGSSVQTDEEARIMVSNARSALTAASTKFGPTNRAGRIIDANDPSRRVDAFGEALAKENDDTPGALYASNPRIFVLTQYLLNNMYAESQILQLTVGDCANIKNEEELVKRYKQYIAAYERMDLTATWQGVPVLDRSKEDWDCEKAIYVSDLEARQDETDPAQWKRITGFYNISQYWNDTVLPQLTAAMRNGELSADEAQMIVDGYSSMNIADGMSLRNPNSYRKLMIMSNHWSDEKERVFNAIMEGTASLKDITTAFQSLKPFVNSNEFVTKEGTYIDDDGIERKYKYTVKVPVQYKNSEVLLFAMIANMAKYAGGENSVLAGLAKTMVEDDIDVCHFGSVVKVGKFNLVDISSCRNAREVQSSIREQLAEFKALKDAGRTTHDGIHRTKYYDYGIIMSTPPHIEDVEQGIGTQIRKLITCDIPDEYRGKPTMIDVRDADGTIVKSFNKSEFKEKYNEILVEKVRRSFLEVQKDFEDRNELIRLIRNSVLGTDRYGREVVNAIELTEDGEFRFPLDHPSLASDISNILTSYIKKRVVKQVTRGGTAYQVSSIGFADTLKPETETLPDGTIRLKSVPCLLPMWAKAIFRAYMDREGNVDINSVPDSLKEMIGYRVPTEYMYSMVPLRVVGFTNEANGASIILPQEIVCWSGSDFDIDKLFLMMPEFRVPKNATRRINNTADLYYDKKGRIRVKKDTVDYLWNAAWDRHSDLKEKATRAWAAQNGSYGSKIIDFLSEEERKMLNDEVIGQLKTIVRDGTDLVYEPEYVKPDFNKDVTEMEDAELNNALLALMRGRLTSNFSFWQVQRVGGFIPQKRMSRLMTILSGIDRHKLHELFPSAGTVRNAVKLLENMSLDALTDMANRTKEKSSYTDPLFFEKYHKQNMVGAEMIGIFVLANSTQALIQDTKLEVTEDCAAFFNISVNGERRRSLHEINNADGMSIITITAGFLAASVDNVKDPLLEALNLNPMTADVALALLRLGYPMKTVMLVLCNPVTKALVKKASSAVEEGRSASSAFKSAIPRDIIKMTSDLTDDAMIEDMLDNKTVNWQNLTETQSNVIALLKFATVVGEQLMCLTNIMKVDATKSSLQKTKGETYNVAKAIPAFNANNKRTYKVRDRFVNFDILGNIESIANDYFCTRLDKIPTTQQYIDRFIHGKRSDGTQTNPGFAQSQVWYDLGLKMGQRLVSKFMFAWGKEVDDLMITLNDMARDGATMPLNAQCCNQLAEDLVFFKTCLAFKDDNDQRSYREQRAAYLRSFPGHFLEVIQKKSEEGENLRAKYLILNMIAVDQETNELTFVRTGRIDKTMSDELQASWEQMLTDEDQDVVDLALGMCVYSAFRDGFKFRYVAVTVAHKDHKGDWVQGGKVKAGGNFGYLCPVAVLEQFPKYQEALRNLNTPLSGEDRAAFIDQFFRTNLSWKGGTWLDALHSNPKDINIHLETAGEVSALEAIFCTQEETTVSTYEKKVRGHKNKLKDDIVVYPNVSKETRKKFIKETYYNEQRDSASRIYWHFVNIMFDGAFYYYRLEEQKDDGTLRYKRIDKLDGMGYDPEAKMDNTYLRIEYKMDDAELMSATAKDQNPPVVPQPTVQQGPTVAPVTPVGAAVVAEMQTTADKAIAQMEYNKSLIRNEGSVDKNGVEHNDRQQYQIEVSPGKVVNAIRVHEALGVENPLKNMTDQQSIIYMTNAMNVGSAVDTVLRDYFTNRQWNPAPLVATLRDQGYYDPEGIAQAFFDSVLDFELKYPDTAGYKLLADNITTWTKRSDLTGYVAGEVDLLMKKPDGTFALFDFKCSGNPNSLINGTERDQINLRKKYGNQLYAYKVMLERQYGITVNELYILPIERSKSSLTMLSPVPFESFARTTYVDRIFRTWEGTEGQKTLNSILELGKEYFDGKGVESLKDVVKNTMVDKQPDATEMRTKILDGQSDEDGRTRVPPLISSISDATKRQEAIVKFKKLFDDFDNQVC